VVTVVIDVVLVDVLVMPVEDVLLIVVVVAVEVELALSEVAVVVHASSCCFPSSYLLRASHLLIYCHVM
jgi:hypothetical protein